MQFAVYLLAEGQINLVEILFRFIYAFWYPLRWIFIYFHLHTLFSLILIMTLSTFEVISNFLAVKKET